MSLRFLLNRRRLNSQSIEKEVDLSFIKDAIISNIYAMKLVGNENDIVDIDIGDLTSQGTTRVTIYYRKESPRPKRTKTY